ncbi:DUF6483 family protein [Paenibacillus sp. SYP-B4298]|uniref:DUF6483 family protein n=1 Tax=Paenibacillus sp. SYP-B4298 TaxID=2996034 RepID=UPI0022DD31FE|nr:DUF6483 family protein [Paenibacillus sp. SYP-B4298]
MFQRDYLMRMIHQMSEAMGKIMGLRQQRESKEALELIDELLDRYFRLNSRLLESLSPEDIIHLMTRSGNIDYPSLQAIGLLLRERAAICEDEGEEERAAALRARALHLFLRCSLDRSGTTAADPDEEAQELERLLAPYKLPEPLGRHLLRWHEVNGRLAKAEDLLYELLEDGALEAVEAQRFYRRLEQLEDEQLEAGGLSRSEIREATEQLELQWNQQGV